MPDKRPKVPLILEGAMGLLRDHGDHGLTMRKVAERAGISLGHLQHYFPTKNEVLKGLVSSHFELCITALRQHIASESATDPSRLVARLVAFGFSYVGDGFSDTWRLFREFWALSSRNPEVREHLDAYYKEYGAILFELLLPVAESPAAARRAVALLLPWFEGYSVTAASLALDEEAMASQLTESVLAALGAVGACSPIQSQAATQKGHSARTT